MVESAARMMLSDTQFQDSPNRENMQILSIIPARGGSKGILRKNLQFIAGKPLVVHNIEQALQSRFIQRVVVSTDDAEIGAVAQQHGAEVVWRPAEISGDRASSESALLHVLERLQANEDYRPDILVFLQCTSPLTLAEDMDGTIQALLDGQADTALAVTHFHYFLWKSGDGRDALGINHDKRRRPLRQEREPQFLETGAVYVMRVAGFLAARHRFFGKTAMYVMPPERCFEIDEPVDLQIAEVLLRQQQRLRQAAALPEPVAGLALDFDGVFTDNRVLVLQDGQEAVFASRSDGWGLAQLKMRGLPLVVLSSEPNPVVEARCQKLGIQCQHGLGDKLAALRAWAAEKQIDLAHVIYLGNDLNDLDCLQAVGCGAVVADAHPAVRRAASLILSQPGGGGAIREICDLIIEQGTLPGSSAPPVEER